MSTLERRNVDMSRSSEGSLSISPRRRVLIASRCAKTIYSQRINLARTARDRGWDVTLAGQAVEGPYQALIEAEGIQFRPVPINQQSLSIFSIVGAIIAFWTLCRSQKPDVFHAFTIKPTVAGLIAAWLARVPTRVATVAGLGHVFVSSSRLVRQVGILSLRLSLLAANRVYFYNEHDREAYVGLGIVKFEKTRIILGSGVDTLHYEALALPNGERLQLLYVGRIIQEKGIIELISAMQMVRSKRPVALHIVGDLDRHNPTSLSKEVFEDKISSIDAIWHGHSNDITRHLAAADVVVLPSYSEGIPLALLEAGASGRAMIATDVPGCRDVVRHGLTGILVPLGDVPQLARAIATMADDHDLVEYFGKNARDDIVARFDSRIVNGKMVDHYDELSVNGSAFPAKTET